MSRNFGLKTMASSSSSTFGSNHLHPGTRISAGMAGGKALRLPHPRVQEINGQRARDSCSHIDPMTGRPCPKRSLPEPKCRCAAAVCSLNRSDRLAGQRSGMCKSSTSTSSSPSIISNNGSSPFGGGKKSLLMSDRGHSSHLNNNYLPTYQKMVTFNLTPSYRTRSAPPLLRSRSVELVSSFTSFSSAGPGPVKCGLECVREKNGYRFFGTFLSIRLFLLGTPLALMREVCVGAVKLKRMFVCGSQEC